MSPLSTIWLVARRELREGLRSRALRASLVVQVLLVVGIAIAAGTSSGDDAPPQRTLGVVGATTESTIGAARDRDDAFDLRLRVRELPDEGAARRAVRDEDVDAALVGERLLMPEDPDSNLVALVQTSWRATRSAERLRREGLTARQVAAALTPEPLATARVAPAEGSGGEGLAFLGALLLYVAVLMGGYAIAASVVGEKSSRVIEIVLATIRPGQLLGGKVIGIGIVALLQVAITILFGLAAVLAIGGVDLPASTTKTGVLVAIYFLLGYALYGMAFAATASIVSRQEDLNSTTTPLMILLIGGFILSTSALSNPDGSLAVVSTFVPPIAPLVVPGRGAQGALPDWQLAVSIALMALSVLGVGRLAARIYARSVLRFGTPMKLSQALRLR